MVTILIKEAFGTGNTLDEAKEAALKALEAPADADIKYDVIERPKAKVLGIFGGSLAEFGSCFITYYIYNPRALAKFYHRAMCISKVFSLHLPC